MRPALPSLAALGLAAASVFACGGGSGSPPAGGSVGSGPASGAPIDPGAAPDTLRDVAVTTVAAGDRADAVPPGPTVVASKTAVVVEERAVAEIKDGQIDPSTIEGATDRVVPLVRWATDWSKTATPDPQRRVRLAIEPTLSANLLLQLAASFEPTGERELALVVRTPDGPGALPVRLPGDAGELGTLTPDPTQLQLVLALGPGEATLFSVSGVEGSVDNPKARLVAGQPGWTAALRTALAEIVTRRWGDRPRAPADQTITVLLDARVTTADLVAAMVAVRHADGGVPLFPIVELATGIGGPLVASAKPPPPPARGADDKTAPVVQQEEDALREEVERYAMALIMEGDGSNATMGKRDPGADLDQQIRNVKEGGSAVSVGGSTGTMRGAVATGPEPTIGSGGSSGALAAPTGRISVSGRKAFDDSSLTADIVLRKMQATYMAGMKRCYKNALKTDPTTSGRVTLQFTVNEVGRVLAPKATAPSDEMKACFEGLMSSWRFPVPKDEDDEPTEATFSFSLNLVPS